MKQLSPSKLSTFLECPAKFKYKYIDRLPEPTSTAAETGTLVHAALEFLYDCPAEERVLARALQCFDQVVDGYPDADPEKAELLLRNIFELEDPTTIHVLNNEMDINYQDGYGRQHRGIIDRVDETPDGHVRIVDYKTGKAPADKDLKDKSLGIRFYGNLATLLGLAPTKLVLLYLGTPQKIEFDVTPSMLRSISNKITQSWDRIDENEESGNWPPKPGLACRWCPFKEMCPEG